MNSQPEPVPVTINPDPAACLCASTCARDVETFSPDWHPQLGERLDGFPRFVAVRARPSAEPVSCWPDFATFIEDSMARQMMYYPAEESAISVRVQFSEQDRGWQAVVYWDAELLRY